MILLIKMHFFIIAVISLIFVFNILFKLRSFQVALSLNYKLNKHIESNLNR